MRNSLKAIIFIAILSLLIAVAMQIELRDKYEPFEPVGGFEIPEDTWTKDCEPYCKG